MTTIISTHSCHSGAMAELLLGWATSISFPSLSTGNSAIVIPSRAETLMVSQCAIPRGLPPPRLQGDVMRLDPRQCEVEFTKPPVRGFWPITYAIFTGT